MPLSQRDLENIRAIVREELEKSQRNDRAPSGEATELDEATEQRIRDDLQQMRAWRLHERPYMDEYFAARAAYRRGAPNAEHRWHAVRLTAATDQLEWGRANDFPKFIKSAARMVTMLERETPEPYVHRPRKKKP